MTTLRSILRRIFGVRSRATTWRPISGTSSLLLVNAPGCKWGRR